MMLLLRLAVVWVLAGIIVMLSGCFSAGGRVYLGYEVQDEIRTTAITHPNHMSITDRLWQWATTNDKEEA